MTFRPERASDWEAIHQVNAAAFGSADEANLVDALRSGGHVLVSLVAETQAGLVGHVLFSRMWIATGNGRVAAVALAPVAVLPTHQRQGVGSALIKCGLEALRAGGEDVVMVLGHPEYYTRFGFSATLASALESPFPAEAYMALELRAGALRDVAGSVVYPDAFGL